MVTAVPWTAERVAGLAPDPASEKAGRALAAPARWSGAGASEDAVWGFCQGSGKKPYQTCVELAEPAFRCSCPSRKFPCKHALGLLMLWAAGRVDAAEPPEWVHAWLAERADRARRAEKRAEAAGPKDEEAAARRASERAARVESGVAELKAWLTDRIGAGFAGFERTGGEELRTVAARMVDAQASGLAGGLRRAAGIVGRRDWPEASLAELSQLYLLADAATRLASLPPALAETVRTRLGFSVETAKVLENGERVADEWLITGAADEENDRLLTRRTWLRGLGTGRDALVLSFAPPGRPLDTSLPPGHRLTAELAFHPGAAPLRALVAERGIPLPAPTAEGGSISAALAAYAQAMAADPWLERWPVLLSGVTPAEHAGGWCLSEKDGTALPLVPSVFPWSLLALSAGRPLTVAAEWSPAGLRPLTCWHENRAVRL
ncbi:SWIM zinc finger family protein [Amycolatopsis sp.]|uniref:SWIM zinc finger family protein n=1 Tax=Amycolatopsis sp. TaxID=37632 RepID=UPI002D7FC3C4|nr:SWIM zinc finger family protein [Amycolatopsis sp.]HET6706707.1 SWIM zinc finger family protein [Amycolatopsis sp.]